MKHRFADLTAPEALQAAIGIERRNTELYRNLAEMFQHYDGKLGDIFAAMAEEEVSHEKQLVEYMQTNFPGQSPVQGAEVDLHEAVEAPDLEEPEVFIFDNVTVEQAIAMAERAETRAFEFYRTMAGQVPDEGLRALCRHMAEVEAGHRDTFVHWKKR